MKHKIIFFDRMMNRHEITTERPQGISGQIKKKGLILISNEKLEVE